MISVHNVPYVLKCIRHIFPHEIPRSDHVTCPSIPFVRLPHFFYDAYLLHKQTASRSRQTGAFPGDGKILIIPNSE